MSRETVKLHIVDTNFAAFAFISMLSLGGKAYKRCQPELLFLYAIVIIL